MPQGANITIKKNDGTTDIVWTFVSPSAGDKSPAVWRSTSGGGTMLVQPTFTHSSMNNGTNTARRHYGEVVYPEWYLDVNSQVKMANKASAKFDILVPMGMTPTALNEFVSQSLNLFAATLIKDCVKAGYAAT